ncbi:DMT family transporter [Paracoccus tegillarcae]|uniref:EamA family transporter n=1 Tax=Paracoccus tegillarcae TaxID=1529068 RepID=A0A2K9EGE5_9RHOB|nr:DMT family transporter [Paracoccus tegillarcae]AUH32397.1 EamA family transporter [Paracoccus tegillarcae]
MSGQGFALLAALFYGMAGVTIAKGRSTARGDNGVFLSVLVTACMSGGLWRLQGQTDASDLLASDALIPVAAFIAAGMFSMVMGRTTMYRATEQIGPVATSLLRRLTPVFALPIAFLILAEVPTWGTVLGAALVICAILIHIGRPTLVSKGAVDAGWAMGVASAVFYALSYALRSYGLDRIPDAAMGTFIGALAGLLWMQGAAALGPKPRARLHRLYVDQGRWHWLTAITLSGGQLCQFFALKSTSVVVVATLGSLEVLFTAFLGHALLGRTRIGQARIWLPAGLAAIGTALLML